MFIKLKKDENDQFLYEVSCNTPIDDVIKELVEVSYSQKKEENVYIKN